MNFVAGEPPEEYQGEEGEQEQEQQEEAEILGNSEHEVVHKVRYQANHPDWMMFCSKMVL